MKSGLGAKEERDSRPWKCLRGNFIGVWENPKTLNPKTLTPVHDGDSPNSYMAYRSPSTLNPKPLQVRSTFNPNYLQLDRLYLLSGGGVVTTKL